MRACDVFTLHVALHIDVHVAVQVDVDVAVHVDVDAHVAVQVDVDSHVALPVAHLFSMTLPPLLQDTGAFMVLLHVYIFTSPCGLL